MTRAVTADEVVAALDGLVSEEGEEREAEDVDFKSEKWREDSLVELIRFFRL